MKNKAIIIFTVLLSVMLLTAAASADGPQGVYQQQSYPVPQLYPIGQIPYPNNYQPPVYQEPQQYTYPQPETYQQPYQQQYYYYPQYQPLPYETYPYYYQYEPQPIYDPYSGQYFYPISNEPGSIMPFQPSYPNQQNSNVQVSKQRNGDGSINLNWLIRNISGEDWDRKNVDIKCTSGCHLLTNPNQTLWDIPYTVLRNGTLSFTVNIWQPMYGETMSFALVAGSKTIYSFNVNPN